MHVPSRQSLLSQLSSSQLSLSLELPESDKLIFYNAIVQKEASAKKKELKKELPKLQAITKITTNPEYYSFQISDIQKNIKSQDNRLNKLKRHKEQLVIRYDSRGHPPLLFQYPNLHDYIHFCIEFGEADTQRQCEIIKVRTINYLRTALEEIQ
ncbi:23044_t:CDS:2 [Dentiscutata erythropus]|uniref:23044_t:CDS:1 n=1 Tax=Dentiscutata erythropus TaxID=1348616 RepID=A0A9N9E4B3_9GLOM|nr:23044_t:CDS:2 [Dentiscutata erythropus]